ncbi:hypothetical protein BD414DRAFT_524160 [Trametes punicea]|nr:hypothetical protein BD414DRAFT_524160 [Trametes punicea]
MPAPAESGIGTDLSKLTVPQLKAICKEKKIVGYSKLGKQALILKLADAGYGPSDTAASATAAGGAQSSSGTAPAITAVTARQPVDESDGIEASVSGPAAAHAPPPRKARAKAAASSSKSKPHKMRPSTQHGEVGTPSKGSSQAATASVASLPVRLAEKGTWAIAPVSEALTRNANAPASALASRRDLAIPDASGSGGACPDLTPSSSSLLKGKKRLGEEYAPPPASKRTCIQPGQMTARRSQADVAVPLVNPGSIMRPCLSVAAEISQPVQALPIATNATGGSTITNSGLSSLPPAKRFRPLVINSTALSTSPNLMSQTECSEAPYPLQYLDFPALCMPPPTLQSISLPPPLAQRKRVARWAVILSGLSDRERAECVLVSRTFRYAVYLSASSILLREYRGKRLQEDVLKRYSQAMTNMWPYLRMRETEVSGRRRIYEASFLPRFFRRCGLPDPIARLIWASPDHPRQLAVALRFVLTRVWFELSIGTPDGTRDDPECWLHGIVVDVQEVVKDEIWSITLEYPRSATRERRRETVFVLEATCEVVGRPLPKTSNDENPSPQSFPVRADWSAYIARRTASPSAEAPLLSRLKWACHEEFDRGMGRLWLKKIAQEGEIGHVKRTVAERYIMASVVANSISGQWMSATVMAQEFAGLPARGAPVATGRVRTPTVNLYLPEHHHVESVHFTSSRGNALHAALAVVQTPHREYVILRDNGMQVGCEDEGVAPVWQRVLGCDHRGLPT